MELLFFRFRELATILAPWIAELSSRARTTPEAVSAMTEAANSYWRARQLVAGDVIRTNLARLAAGERNGGCTAQVRACSSYAIRACRAEQSLYLTWFEPLNIVTTAEHGTKITSAGTGNESTADRGCWNTVTSGDGSSTPCRSAATPVVQGAWYDVLRPLILMQSELSELCEVVLIFRTEVLPAIVNGGVLSAPSESIAQALLQDAQERLIFRVQAHVRDRITLFRPSATDLAFPRASTVALSDADQLSTVLKTSGGLASDYVNSDAQWYVTVTRALTCLAQLYRCVPRAVFEGIAQEILSECSASVKCAAVMIGAAKRSPLDATLFTISQLLVLREQIAPFDSAFAITHKSLDFSHTRKAMWRLLESRGRIGGLGAAMGLLQSGAPSLVTDRQDAKAALDRDLRAACEQYIAHCNGTIAEPLKQLLTKATLPTAVSVATHGDMCTPYGVNVSTATITEAIKVAETGVQGELSPAHALMAAYLPETSTQCILFGPVKTALLAQLAQLQTLLNTRGSTWSAVEAKRLSRLAADVEGYFPG